MKLNLKGIAGAAALALLTGCATTPQDVDKTEVKKEFHVDQEFEALYFRLTNPANGGGYCDMVFRSAIYPERGEFRVYYGQQSGGIGYTIPIVTSAIYGYRAENGLRIQVRNTLRPTFGDRVVRALSNYVETGSCE